MWWINLICDELVISVKCFFFLANFSQMFKPCEYTKSTAFTFGYKINFVVVLN